MQIEKEFYRLAAARVNDLGAAFKLADLAAITVGADGTVDGIDTAVNTVIRSYPFLSDEPTDEPPDRATAVPDGPLEGGSPTIRRRQAPVANTSALHKKFPALGRR